MMLRGHATRIGLLALAAASPGCLDLFAEPTPRADRGGGPALDAETPDAAGGGGRGDTTPAPDAPDAAPCPEGCALDGADARCERGRCVVVGCHAGRVDLDGVAHNGCEYACLAAADGLERCDAADNDCDGVVDEELTPPRVVGRDGVCATALHVCEGRSGWREPDDETIDGYEADEARCDGLDNDCDGWVDEAHPARGDACAAGVGACARQGIMVCTAAGDGLTCTARAGPPRASDGRCDGVDDDCDGRVDEDPPCNGCPPGVEIEDGYVCVPPGAFVMGSPPDEPGRDDDEGPQRQVEITRPFAMLETEVTRSIWLAVFDWDPSEYHCGQLCVGEDEATCPMSRMSWGEAAKFANALTRQANADRGWALTECYVFDDCADDPALLGFDCVDGRRAMPDPAQFCRRHDTAPGCTGYRLPSEAEWAYAARAGTAGRWYGAGEADLGDHAWYAANADGRVHAARLLAPNPWGLYDMLGNVWELVDDYHREDGYAFANGQREVDPRGPADSDYRPPTRARRGGAFNLDAALLRSASRGRQEQQDGFTNTGFRLVRTLSVE